LTAPGLTLERVARFLLPRASNGGILSHAERATLVAVADVLVDARAHGMTADDVADNVETFLCVGRSRRAWRVRLLLRAIELSSLPRFARPFRRLSREERRVVVLEDWASGGRVGRLCAKVKNLVILGTYGDPRAAAKTGYVPVDRRRRFVISSAGADA
jgi:hypothetical protein